MTSPNAQPTAEIRQMPKPAEARGPQAPATAARGRRRGRSRFVLPLLAAVALGGAGYYGHEYWTVGRFMVSTDDAYLEADIASVSPKIAGYVADVPVIENQHVKAGDPLFLLDDGDLKIALEQAQAQIVSQDRALDRIDAQIVAARAALDQAQAQRASAQAVADNADRNRDRLIQLLATKVATRAQVDDATTAAHEAAAALLGANAQVDAAEANIGVLEAQKAEAQAAMRSLKLAEAKAERDLTFTTLRAPYDGVVANLAVQQGDFVGTGQKLAVIVPTEKLYVSANFKETQLAEIVPGETATVSVDALGGRSYAGKVVSIAPASGSLFSLLPPENATGNFTKVVQRYPVRIELPADAFADARLRAGFSVVVDVDGRTAPAGVQTADSQPARTQTATR